MFFSSESRAQTPLNLASLPGVVAAVQLASEQRMPKPALRVAQVSASPASADAGLEALVRELHGKRTPLRLLLEPGEYQFLQTELPEVPAEELKNATRWQVKDMLRHPLDAVTLEVLAPADAGGPAGRRAAGFVVAAANELLRRRMLQFRPWGSEVRAIDVPELAQRNIADRLEETGHATAVLSLTPAGCLLTVSREGMLYFVRNFEISSLSLRGASAVRQELFDRLVLDLQRSIDVLEHQYSYLAVSALWVAPFGQRDELLGQLIDNLYLPVRAIELEALFDTTSCPLPADPEQQGALFHVLGLALRGLEGAA